MNAVNVERELNLDCQPPADGLETVRWWEVDSPVVVLGHSSRMHQDVRLERCAADGVAVVRRASGGGTVLLSRGCLNYALALRLDQRPQLENVAISYRIILGGIAAALGLCVAGTDLLLGDQKVSGSAQRRTAGWLLHHGTFLYDMDLDLVSKYLHEPQRQPPHRRTRTHHEFLRNFPADAGKIRSATERVVLPSSRGIF